MNPVSRHRFFAADSVELVRSADTTPLDLDCDPHQAFQLTRKDELMKDWRRNALRHQR